MSASTPDPGIVQRVYMTLSRYFYGLDAKDAGVLATCFTGDVEAIYHTGGAADQRHRGREQLLARFSANMLNYSTRTHALANFHIWMHGTVAHAVSHAVVTLVRNQRVMVRGIRYVDELVEDSGDWRIRRREHVAMWQYETARTRLEVPSTPVTVDDSDVYT